MTRRFRKTPKMELYRRRAPDYTELAYREAVAKLKYLLAESYTPVSIHKPSSVSNTMFTFFEVRKRDMIHINNLKFMTGNISHI